MDTQQKLDQLAELQAQRTLAEIDMQALIDSVLTAEIKAKIAEIKAEFEPRLEAIDTVTAGLEAEIKTDVITAGATIKSEHLQAVYTKGRITWDTKALDGYAAAHPEIQPFRKEGSPSVSIRKV